MNFLLKDPREYAYVEKNYERISSLTCNMQRQQLQSCNQKSSHYYYYYTTSRKVRTYDCELLYVNIKRLLCADKSSTSQNIINASFLAFVDDACALCPFSHKYNLYLYERGRHDRLQASASSVQLKQIKRTEAFNIFFSLKKQQFSDCCSYKHIRCLNNEIERVYMC